MRGMSYTLCWSFPLLNVSGPLEYRSVVGSWREAGYSLFHLRETAGVLHDLSHTHPTPLASAASF